MWTTIVGTSHFLWTPLFEWCMARIVVKNGHQKDTCYNEIGLCAQHISTILGSLVNNTIGRMYLIT